jgi:hypothetical protein
VQVEKASMRRKRSASVGSRPSARRRNARECARELGLERKKYTAIARISTREAGRPTVRENHTMKRTSERLPRSGRRVQSAEAAGLSMRR